MVWFGVPGMRLKRGARDRTGTAGPVPRFLPSLGALAGLLSLVLSLAGSGAVRAAPAREKIGNLTGKLLVATTELRDPRFARTVVYMVRHDSNGAMGLVVNRPIQEVSLARLLEGLGIDSQGVGGDVRLHYGGPVEPTRGFVLHTSDYASQSTQIIHDGIALTREPEILRVIGTGGGPRRSLVILGYAGWAPGQLEGEIGADAWVIIPADQALVFDDNNEGKWKRAMARRIIEL